MMRDELQDLLDRMAAAYSAGDAQGCADLFTLNAQLHSPFAPPALGRDAIRALHDDWVAEPSAKRFEILDHGGADDLAWCLCRFLEGGAAAAGTSQIVLERQSDGAWLVRSCCLFAND